MNSTITYHHHRLFSLFTIIIGVIVVCGCQMTTTNDSAVNDGAGFNEAVFNGSVQNAPQQDVEVITQQAIDRMQATLDRKRQAANQPEEIVWMTNSPQSSVGDAPAGHAIATIADYHTITPPTPRRTSATQSDQSVAATTPTPTTSSTSHDQVDETIHAVKELTKEELLTQLICSIKSYQGDNGVNLKAYMSRAALSVVDPRQTLTEEDVKNLPSRDRRLVMAYQRVFSQLGQELGKNSRTDRELLKDACDELSEQVDSWRDMRIKNIRLCTSVKSFGVYEEFKKNIFLAGTEHPMIVYAELEHFTPILNSDGRYEVRLKQELVLYKEYEHGSEDLVVWHKRPVSIVDKSVNRRRDFFVRQVIYLPKILTVGKYTLKIRITDELGHSEDEAMIPIEIVADPQIIKGK